MSVRLVRADSGNELASFRETGDGPKGLIEAADKLARALRSKAGESLRLVNATPPLIQATTSSLEALRKYSAAVARQRARRRSCDRHWRARRWRSTRPSRRRGARSRRNLVELRRIAVGDRFGADAGVPLSRSPARARARRADGALLHHGPGSRSCEGDRGVRIDPPARRAPRRRSWWTSARRSGRDASSRAPNHSTSRRSGCRRRNGTAYGNAIEMQLNQGKFEGRGGARRTSCTSISPPVRDEREMRLSYASGDLKTVRRLSDSLLNAGGDARRRSGLYSAMVIALLDGRLHAADSVASRSSCGKCAPLGGGRSLRCDDRRRGHGRDAHASRARGLDRRAHPVSRAADDRSALPVFRGHARTGRQAGEGAGDARALPLGDDRHLDRSRAGRRSSTMCWGRSLSRRASRGKRSTNFVAATSGSTARRRTSARRACRSTSRARTTPRASRIPRR